MTGKVYAKEIEQALNSILYDKNDLYCKKLWTEINEKITPEVRQFTIVLTITKDYDFNRCKLFEVHQDFGEITIQTKEKIPNVSTT